MRAVFIADSHLKGGDGAGQASLAGFLDSVEADTLVVLGDLLDFWTGSNSVAAKKYKPVLDGLLRLKERGVKIIYCEGNHDFSMGPFFTDNLNASVITDTAEVDMDGKRFLLGHGDAVSMTGGYRLWRRYLRSPLFRVTAALLTPRAVWAIAAMLSRKSRGKGGRCPSSVNLVEMKLKGFARKKIAEGADAVVLGHSHEAGVQVEGAGGRSGVYANPGSWAAQKTYLVYEDGGFSIRKWKERADGDTL